jgi:hypothetical protein
VGQRDPDSRHQGQLTWCAATSMRPMSAVARMERSEIREQLTGCPGFRFASPGLLAELDASCSSGEPNHIRSRSVASSERLLGRNSHAQHRSIAPRPVNQAR